MILEPKDKDLFNEDALLYLSFNYNGSTQEIALRNEYENANKVEHEGIYTCIVFHGASEEPTYSVARSLVIVEEPTEEPTEEEGPDDMTMGANHVCSVFPGGVVESFDGAGRQYDLSCTHVLAADIMTDGDYSNPWFIYGTFDQHDGHTALMSMTFYVGNVAFEFQRGWLINLNGNGKMSLKEGVDIRVPHTGCWVRFSDKHLQLQCQYFEAYYDGVMSGHIRLKTMRSTAQLEKRFGNVGLCWDGESGWRKNWQIGMSTGQCEVSVEDKSCKLPDSNFNQYRRDAPAAALGLGAWALCEAGPAKSSSEIHCGGRKATAAQECSLQQAARIMCSLKYSTLLRGSDDKCPADECVWKKDVFERGCPQKIPPFVCA